MLRFGIRTPSSNELSTFVTISKPKEYIHRVLAGGNEINSVFYPTLEYNEEEMTMKQVWKVIKKSPKQGSEVLDFLEKVDVSIRKRNSGDPSKQIRSQFTPTKRWVYLILDREDPEPTIKIAQYPLSVALDLDKIQKKLDTEDPKYLRYGPTFSWDALITHEYDERKKGPEFSKHSYSVTPDPKNTKFYGKFPKDIVDSEKYPNPIELLDEDTLEQIFSEAEWGAIENCEIDLGDISKPDSEDDIRKQLLEDYPPYLNADRDGVPIFPYPDEFLKDLEKEGFKVLTESDEKKELPEGIMAESKKEDKEEDSSKILERIKKKKKEKAESEKEDSEKKIELK